MTHPRRIGFLSASLLLSVLTACGGDSVDGPAGDIGGVGGTAGTAGTGGEAGSSGGTGGSGSTGGTGGASNTGGTGGTSGEAGTCGPGCSAVAPPDWHDGPPTAALVGTSLYALHIGGLSIVDVSDPDSLAIQSTLAIPGDEAKALYSRGSVLLAVMETWQSLQDPTTHNDVVAVDVSNTAAPVVVAELELPGAWTGWGRSETRDVGTSLQGFNETNEQTTLWSLNVDDPGHPVLAGEFAFGGASEPSFSGKWGFLGFYSPVGTSALDLDTATDVADAIAIPAYLAEPDVAGDVVRALSGAGFAAYRLSDAEPSVALGAVEPDLACAEKLMTQRLDGNTAVGLISRDILVSESSGNMCDGLGVHYPIKLVTVDMSDPSAPHLSETLDIPFEASDAIMMQGTVLVAGKGNLLAHAALFDHTDPTTPQNVGTVPLTFEYVSTMQLLAPIGLALATGRADPYGQDSTMVIQLLDLGDSTFAARGSIELPTDLVDAWWTGGRLVILTQTEVVVVDIDDRDQPEVTSRVLLPGN